MFYPCRLAILTIVRVDQFWRVPTHRESSTLTHSHTLRFLPTLVKYFLRFLTLRFDGLRFRFLLGFWAQGLEASMPSSGRPTLDNSQARMRPSTAKLDSGIPTQSNRLSVYWYALPCLREPFALIL
jgi:hypothetical protein